jgi:serine/threonine protein kinase
MSQQPSKVADFEAVKQLGRGSFGSTYLVKRIVDGNFYCMKRISIYEMSTKDQANSINEARFLASLTSDDSNSPQFLLFYLIFSLTNYYFFFKFNFLYFITCNIIDTLLLVM